MSVSASVCQRVHEGRVHEVRVLAAEDKKQLEISALGHNIKLSMR